jgi:hypothetical protein
MEESAIGLSVGEGAAIILAPHWSESRCFFACRWNMGCYGIRGLISRKVE